MSNVIQLNPEQAAARQRIDLFVRRFQPTYRLLAYYAALPLVLTPELLHYLRSQFLRGVGVPWVGEVDLLLSDLCRPIGYEQYAMDTAVRAVLLEEMERVLGQPKIVAAANLLVRYVDQLERTNPYLSRQELQAQQLAALLCLDGEQGARKLTTAYQQAANSRGIAGRSGANRGELAWLSRLTQELTPQLKKYPKLLEYAAVVGQALSDPTQVKAEALWQPYQVLEDVALRAPEGLVAGLVAPLVVGMPAPALMTCEFDVAEIAFEGDTKPKPTAIQLQPFAFATITIVGLLTLSQWDQERLLDAIDAEIFSLYNRHLNEIERIVLSQTLKNQTYGQMVREASSDLTALKQVGRELWQTLSSLWGEKVTKTNFSAVLDQWLWQQGIQREQRQGQQFVEALGNAVSFVMAGDDVIVTSQGGPVVTQGDQSVLEMVQIPGGSFLMGSPEDELEREEDESPQHTVTIAPFFMGKHPITQAQWRAVAALPQVNRELNADPSNFKGDDRPVEKVSWFDAVEFCDRLSQLTGRPYRLPSEAEWEYACRANPVASAGSLRAGDAVGNGTVTPFHFGEAITTDLANYNGNYTYGHGPKGIYRQETTPVGSFQVANAFGLYDMHGNVWEWCQDHWHDNYEGAPADGSAWVDAVAEKDVARVLRGGSWFNSPAYCRSARRYDFYPGVRLYDYGFRVVCSA